MQGHVSVVQALLLRKGVHLIRGLASASIPFSAHILADCRVLIRILILILVREVGICPVWIGLRGTKAAVSPQKIAFPSGLDALGGVVSSNLRAKPRPLRVTDRTDPNSSWKGGGGTRLPDGVGVGRGEDVMEGGGQPRSSW